jgi:cobalamin-dependent methionine synthase I
MEKAAGEIRRHARPKAIYRFLPVESKNGSSVALDGGVSLKSEKLADIFGPCDRAAVFLVTMGSGLDRIIQQNMEKRPHYGFLLDAAASVAAEGGAQYVQDYLEQERLNSSEDMTLRYSPGYCDWPLKEQKSLFNALPYAEIDVGLSDDSLMSPRKTISGVIGICPAGSATYAGNACATCSRTHCPHRREWAKE